MSRYLCSNSGLSIRFTEISNADLRETAGKSAADFCFIFFIFVSICAETS